MICRQTAAHYLAANDDHYVHNRTKHSCASFLFLFCSVLMDSVMFAQFLNGNSTLHGFNPGRFVQIVLELIDDYICNLKLFDTIKKMFKLVIGFMFPLFLCSFLCAYLSIGISTFSYF